MRYIVQFKQDTTWEVIRITPRNVSSINSKPDNMYDRVCVFIGGILECESFIRLTVGGYMK